MKVIVGNVSIVVEYKEKVYRFSNEEIKNKDEIKALLEYIKDENNEVLEYEPEYVIIESEKLLARKFIMIDVGNETKLVEMLEI